MSVVSVKLQDPRRGGQDDALARTYTRIYRVLVNSILDDNLTVRLAAGVPRIGDPHPADLGARVRRVQEQKLDSPFLWEVEVEYDSAIRDQQQQAENPLERPAEVQWSFSKYARPVQRSTDGRAFLNSAGLPYDPPLEIDDSRPLLSITRNEAAFSPALAYLYQDAINTDVFFGAAPGVAKCQGISARSAFENGLAYWSVSYEFEFRREGWAIEPLDAGKTELIDGKLLHIAGDDGQPVSDPAPLDGTGRDLRRAVTFLTLALGAEDVAVSVDDTSVFVLAPPFVATIDDEDVLVVSIDDPNTLTVQRAHNGTEAVAHDDSSIFRQAPVFLSLGAYKLLPFLDLNLP